MMKKWLTMLIAGALAALLCLPAGAAVGAFSGEIKTNANTEFHDAGGEKQGGWVEDFGIGNTEAGDYVVFRSVDFGSKGASKAGIRFSFLITEYSPLPCTMELYVDSLSGSPAAVFSIEDTGHWIEDASMWFDAACNIPSGTHDIYLKWKDNTGSLYGIRFTEAGGTVNTTTRPKATTTTRKNATTTTAGRPNTNVTQTTVGSTTTIGSSVATVSPTTRENSEAPASGDTTLTVAVDGDVTMARPGVSTPEEIRDGAPWGLIIGIAAAVLAVVAAVVAIVLIKKKKAV